MNMLDKGKGIELAGSIASNAYYNSPYIKPGKPWIIDSGATDHMTNNLDLLNNLSNMHDPMKSSIYLPNGKNVSVHYQGSCNISYDYTIENVLHVPEFIYNLLSVSKMTKVLQCSVFFFPHFCVFQDICTGKVKGIGKEKGGLYLLSPRTSEEAIDKMANASSNISEKLSEDVQV